MRDSRIPLSVAVPVVIGFLGVLWLLRCRSRSDEKRKTQSKVLPEKDKHATKWNDKTQLEQRTQDVEKEGVTISQRKIPESQARDRGSSDLEVRKLIDLSEATKSQVKTCSLSVNVKTEPSLSVKQGQSKPQTGDTDSKRRDGELSTQSKYVESIVITAINKGLEDAHTGKLAENSCSQQVHQTSVDTGTKDQVHCNEKSPSCRIVKEDLSSRNAVSKLQATTMTIENDNLTKFANVTLNQSSVSRDTQKPYVEKVQVKDSVSNNLSATIKPSICDKSRESFESNSSKIDVLNAVGQNVDNSVQQGLSQAPVKEFSDKLFISHSNGEVSSGSNMKQDNSSKSTSGLDDHEVSVRTPIKTVTSTASNEAGKEKLNSVCDSSHLDGTTTPSSLWIPTTTSSVIDLSYSADAVDSIWSSASPHVQKNLNTSVSSVNTSAVIAPVGVNSSLNPTSVSYDVVDNSVYETPLTYDLSSQLDASQTSMLFSDSLVDTADTSRSENEQALSMKSEKTDSPAKSNSPACDSNSEGSNDSGRGGSEHDVAAYQACETLVHFEFNMPSELCGRFIGKHGKNINYLKNKTGAHLSLANNMYTPDYQICQVVGSQAEVDDVLAMIRRKFPLADYPSLTMAPIELSPAPLVIQPEHQLIIPDVMQLSLPEGVSVDVFVSAIVDAGHLFVQQPTHRSFMSLEKLNYFLGLVYGQDPNVPSIPTPVESGIICVCENDGFWYRAMIMTPEDENGECQVKFVDYGGYAMMNVSSLKQIRADFMSLPFQAVECFMANVTPNQNEQFFSEEATMALSDMTRDKLLQCQVVARVENGIPYIHLYQISTESNSAVMINRALVNSRLVRWIEIL